MKQKKGEKERIGEEGHGLAWSPQYQNQAGLQGHFRKVL
jgi:hypothetical protein